MSRTRGKRLAAGVILVLVVTGVAFGALALPAGGGQEEAGFGWLSVLPPVLAIGLALATRQVIVALLLGVWL